MPEILHFRFNREQACLLAKYSEDVSILGGPDCKGAALAATHYAELLKHSLGKDQLMLLSAYASGRVCAIEFTSMQSPASDPPPDVLPTMSEMAQDPTILNLASRSQILLGLVSFRSFAFDIDNDGMQVRLVGNFKGGGEVLLPEEDRCHTAELSSHSGAGLGPHTEPPYNCSVVSEAGRSPAPSALILTARWNPQAEPTRLIPLRNVVAALNGLEALALSSKSFCFTRSECFIKEESYIPAPNAILQFDHHADFTLRYSSYRYSLYRETCGPAQRAYRRFQELIDVAKPDVFKLQSDTALLINNNQTLHAREIIKDNRRLLVRLFAYSPQAQPVVLQEDPLVVRG